MVRYSWARVVMVKVCPIAGGLAGYFTNGSR